MRSTWTVALLLSVLLPLGGCEVHLGPLEGASTGASGEGDQVTGEVWVYTSIYQSVIEEIDPLLRESNPGLTVHWYRAGSEKVATRLDTELRAGGTQADLVLTSDPFWYLRIKEEGLLMPYTTPAVLPIPREFVDLDGAYATCRVSTMVIAYNPDMIQAEDVPRTFRELAEERYRDQVTLGDPLSSGTHFTTTAFLSHHYGWDFYGRLKEQGALSSGGNSSVMRRIEGREFPVGVVLLENVLKNQAQGSPIRYVIPEDGAITIPGNIAILSSTDNPAGARAVYDAIMSEAGQRAMVEGYMHSANPRIEAPGGAADFEALAGGGFGWSPEFTAEVKDSAAEIKSRFAEIMHDN